MRTFLTWAGLILALMAVCAIDAGSAGWTMAFAIPAGIALTVGVS